MAHRGVALELEVGDTHLASVKAGGHCVAEAIEERHAGHSVLRLSGRPVAMLVRLPVLLLLLALPVATMPVPAIAV